MTEEQLRTYQDQGFILLPSLFSQAEIEVLRAELPAIFAEESPRRVVERDGGIVRSVYGSYRTNEIFRRLSQHPRLVKPVMQIVLGTAYVYQFKINAKAAFGGDLWEWHQDYVFWRKEDELPEPSVVNIAIFLDEVTEFNGPLFLIPGSHKQGVIDVPAKDEWLKNGAKRAEAYKQSPAWISNLTADLKYSLSRETVAGLVSEYGIASPKGPAGSVLFFDCNLVHGSGNNISPFDRVVVIISYCKTSNIPLRTKDPRPDFLVSRDYTPVVPSADDALLS